MGKFQFQLPTSLSLTASSKCNHKSSSSLASETVILISAFSFCFGLLFCIFSNLIVKLASLVAQTVKLLPTMRETWVRSLGQEDPLEKEMATHSSTLAWKIPWTEEPGRL